MYYKDGKEYGSAKAIRNELSNMSLPTFMSDEFIASLGYLVIVDAPKPDHTDVQRVEENGILMIGVVPTRQWKVVDMFESMPEYTSMDGVVYPAQTKEEQEAKFYADKAEAEAKELMKKYTGAMEDYMDLKAQAKGYNDRYTASIRAGNPDSPFYVESKKFATWMDVCYAYGYVKLDEVKTTGVVPTVDDFIASLPILEW